VATIALDNRKETGPQISIICVDLNSKYIFAMQCAFSHILSHGRASMYM